MLCAKGRATAARGFAALVCLSIAASTHAVVIRDVGVGARFMSSGEESIVTAGWGSARALVTAETAEVRNRIEITNNIQGDLRSDIIVEALFTVDLKDGVSSGSADFGWRVDGSITGDMTARHTMNVLDSVVTRFDGRITSSNLVAGDEVFSQGTGSYNDLISLSVGGLVEGVQYAIGLRANLAATPSTVTGVADYFNTASFDFLLGAGVEALNFKGGFASNPRDDVFTTSVPVPAPSIVWLFVTALLGLVGLRGSPREIPAS
jgi:hypothetical protein